MGHLGRFGGWALVALLAIPAFAEGVPEAPHPAPAPPIPLATASPAQVSIIGTEELRARLAKGEPLHLVDVRSAEAFRVEHLPGAHSAPYSQIDARQATLPRGKTLVLYCA